MADEGDAQLAEFIARLKTFGADAHESIAKEAAPLVEAAARETAAAGTDPYGKAWAPKKDGSRALADAASAITAVAKGAVVQIILKGGYAIQNRLKGDSRRQVIPLGDKPLPPAMLEALHEGARRAWRKAM